MRKVDLLLEAMDVLSIHISEMEINSMTGVGSIRAIIDNKEKDLSEEMILKIAKAYGAEFYDVGYYFIDGKAFNQEGTIFTKTNVTP
jgi:hypothetical protein